MTTSCRWPPKPDIKGGRLREFPCICLRMDLIIFCSLVLNSPNKSMRSRIFSSQQEGRMPSVSFKFCGVCSMSNSVTECWNANGIILKISVTDLFSLPWPTSHFCYKYRVFPPKNEVAGDIFIVGINRALPWSQRFSFAAKRISSDRQKWREKTSGYPRCESHYHATIAVNQHHEID